MWWIKDPTRLKSEVALLEAVLQREPWFASMTPRILKGLRFAVDFDIVVNGETFLFALEYPAFFPETPPSVTPRDGRRLSSHQYGAGGEMCLEFRSDNWHPSVTGAMMVESTHRLLATEQPAHDQRAIVPSAHQSTIGQRLRGSTCRFLLTEGLCALSAQLSVGAYRDCSVIEVAGPSGTWIAHVAAVGAPDAPEWKEPSIPARGLKGEVAVLLRVSSLVETEIQDQDALERLIAAVRGPVAVPANDNAVSRFTIIADAASAKLYFSFTNKGTWKTLPYRTIDLTNEGGGRLPEDYAVMAGKKVGLVGCGSLGSKIATSLARSGAGSFVLVDDDILKPPNLVRHELDAESLGIHKVDALEKRLKAVAPNIAVSARRVALGGQESSGSTASVLDELATCDLLIDATADPQAFNFVASVARAALRPMLWSEVYAGGIGGFVARLRPEHEPPPHTARRQYLAWCRQRGVPWLGEGEGDDYDTLREDGRSLVAGDADVSVIAGHASRIAIDLLVRSASAFPHSAYVIGLSKEWIFEAPFHTEPIGFAPEGQWRAEVTEDQPTEAIEFITALLEQGEDADRTGT